MLLGFEIDIVARRVRRLRLTGQGDDNDSLLPVHIEGLTGKTERRHGTVRIDPPTVAVSCRPASSTQSDVSTGVPSMTPFRSRKTPKRPKSRSAIPARLPPISCPPSDSSV